MDNEENAEFWEEPIEGGHPSAHVHKIDFLIVGIGFVRQIAGAIHDTLVTVETLVCAHANYQVDQNVFRDQARFQIEKMTQEEQNG